MKLAMDTTAVLAYRVNGVSYTVLVDCGASPTGNGNEFLQTIPRDPEDFKGKWLLRPFSLPVLTLRTVWIAQNTEYFLQEGKRLGLPDSRPDTWEQYLMRPWSSEPYGNIPWTCVVDQDEK